MQAIDIHSHFFPKEWPDLCTRFGTPDWPTIKHLGNGEADILVGDKFFRRIRAACWDTGVRLGELNDDQIALQVICATPVLFGYHRPAEQALHCAQLFNDAALEMCSRAPGRLNEPVGVVDVARDQLLADHVLDRMVEGDDRIVLDLGHGCHPCPASAGV